jgi:hypothetical protein
MLYSFQLLFFEFLFDIIGLNSQCCLMYYYCGGVGGGGVSGVTGGSGGVTGGSGGPIGDAGGVTGGGCIVPTKGDGGGGAANGTLFVSLVITGVLSAIFDNAPSDGNLPSCALVLSYISSIVVSFGCTGCTGPV